MSKIKKYSEADLTTLYDLKCFVGNDKIPLLSEWLEQTNSVALNSGEQYLFNLIFFDAKEKIKCWDREELKMKFIAFVLKLGHLVDSPPYHTYFEHTIEATVKTNFLKIKTDFMIAKGILNQPQNPYFHFQVWKKYRNPTGDPIAQLLTAFLISQEINQTKHPLYGCAVTGRFWEFIIMIDKNYYMSKSYDCTNEEDLMTIIAILRKCKYLLN